MLKVGPVYKNYHWLKLNSQLRLTRACESFSVLKRAATQKPQPVGTEQGVKTTLADPILAQRPRQQKLSSKGQGKSATLLPATLLPSAV